MVSKPIFGVKEGSGEAGREGGEESERECLWVPFVCSYCKSNAVSEKFGENVNKLH